MDREETDEVFVYRCKDCKVMVKLKPSDPVKCSECGQKILYKVQPIGEIQYEAL